MKAAINKSKMKRGICILERRIKNQVSALKKIWAAPRCHAPRGNILGQEFWPSFPHNIPIPLCQALPPEKPTAYVIEFRLEKP